MAYDSSAVKMAYVQLIGEWILVATCTAGFSQLGPFELPAI